jgi:hypothetical protein
MVKRIFFHTTIILLGLNQLVSGSTNNLALEYTSSPTISFIFSNTGPGYKLSNVPSASYDLPQPPAASTDLFSSVTILRKRNPSDFKNHNTKKSHHEMKKIPSGLHRFYDDIKGEIDWVNAGQAGENAQNRSDALLTLFEHIVNDRVEQFHNFESEFQRIFGTSYEGFSSASRSVLGWLVAFGSSEILRSLELQKFNIDYSNLVVSIKYLVDRHSLPHISDVLRVSPLLLTGSLANCRKFFYHVKNKPIGTPIDNLATLFVNLPAVNLNMVAALIPISADGFSPNTLTELLSDIHKITTSIKTSYNYFKPQDVREKAVKNIKSALQHFLGRCIADFRIIKRGDRFTVASLFIEGENSNALERLLISQPDMLQTLGNGKSILQICIDESSIACAGVVARLRPELITQSNNGLNSPLVQSMMCENTKYFDLFLPLLTSNDLVDFFESQCGMRPTAIAMILGNIKLLKQIVEHFTEYCIPFDLRVDIGVVMDYLEEEWIKAKGKRVRENTLIDHSIWVYLIQEAQIENDHPTYSYSYDPLITTLLDLAVIDNNAEAARLLIERFGARIVNQKCTQGLLQGNCLRFYKHDLNMLKLLVKNGIDLNTPLLITTAVEGDKNVNTMLTPVLIVLLMFPDDAVVEYVNTLKFTEEAYKHAHEFARDPRFSFSLLNIVY